MISILFSEESCKEVLKAWSVKRYKKPLLNVGVLSDVSDVASLSISPSNIFNTDLILFNTQFIKIKFKALYCLQHNQVNEQFGGSALRRKQIEI